MLKWGEREERDILGVFCVNVLKQSEFFGVGGYREGFRIGCILVKLVDVSFYFNGFQGFVVIFRKDIFGWLFS